MTHHNNFSEQHNSLHSCSTSAPARALQTHYKRVDCLWSELIMDKEKKTEENSLGKDGDGGGEPKGGKKEVSGGGGNEMPQSVGGEKEDSGGGKGDESRREVDGGGEDERRLSEGEKRKGNALYPDLSPDSSVEEQPGLLYTTAPCQLSEVG